MKNSGFFDIRWSISSARSSRATEDSDFDFKRPSSFGRISTIFATNTGRKFEVSEDDFELMHREIFKSMAVVDLDSYCQADFEKVNVNFRQSYSRGMTTFLRLRDANDLDFLDELYWNLRDNSALIKEFNFQKQLTLWKRNHEEFQKFEMRFLSAQQGGTADDSDAELSVNRVQFDEYGLTYPVISANQEYSIRVVPHFNAEPANLALRTVAALNIKASNVSKFILPLQRFYEAQNLSYFVTSRLQLGTFANLLTDKTLPLSPGFITYVTACLVDALHNLQKNNIIYRNLNKSTVFLLEDGRPQLSDFLFAREFLQQDSFYSPLYDAPNHKFLPPEYEWINKDKNIQYCKLDVWNLGIFLCEMAAVNNETFNLHLEETLEDHLKTASFIPCQDCNFSVQSEEFQTLLSKLLRLNAQYRPTFSIIKSFAYFSSINFKTLDQLVPPEKNVATDEVDEESCFWKNKVQDSDRKDSTDAMCKRRTEEYRPRSIRGFLEKLGYKTVEVKIGEGTDTEDDFDMFIRPQPFSQIH